jgi:hypothetical protein
VWNYPYFREHDGCRTDTMHTFVMERAGYLRYTRFRAFDIAGLPHEVIELHISGCRYAVRCVDLAAGIAGRCLVQVESLGHEWGYYLGTPGGLAQVSQSGRALNIDLFKGGRYTVSLRAIRSVLDGKEKYAMIVRIPDCRAANPVKIRRIAKDQQRICALV